LRLASPYLMMARLRVLLREPGDLSQAEPTNELASTRTESAGRMWVSPLALLLSECLINRCLCWPRPSRWDRGVSCRAGGRRGPHDPDV